MINIIIIFLQILQRTYTLRLGCQHFEVMQSEATVPPMKFMVNFLVSRLLPILPPPPGNEDKLLQVSHSLRLVQLLLPLEVRG